MTINNPDEIQIVTFGCRLNAYESEIIRGHARANALKNTIVVNTCAVTNEAERKARQEIRKVRRQNPDAKIIVTGCSAQINPKMYANMPEVNHILGNHEKMQAESYQGLDDSRKIVLSDIFEIKETGAHHLASGFENHVRAFIEIQNGCDHRCTFCTIPYGRGNNRSVPIGAIVDQVRTLIMGGCKEIVFTGVDITGYGADLPGKPTLGKMIRRVLAQIPELPRLRLSSLDPAEVDEDLFRLIAEEPRLMPHLHISLQAGDDMILKRMKRRHLRHDVIFFCQHVRSLRPDVVFGADIIAGFPTETEEMHQNSLALIEECNITYLHVFPFSPREGTPAARMPQVQGSLIKKRAENLRVLGKKQYTKFMESRVGMNANVLIESNGKSHCEHYLPVRVQNLIPDVHKGRIIEVEFTHVENDELHAKMRRKTQHELV
jgi:threonylcarbamoyladenosine tRNA methylthiotransferase MtaB